MLKQGHSALCHKGKVYIETTVSDPDTNRHHMCMQAGLRLCMELHCGTLSLRHVVKHFKTYNRVPKLSMTENSTWVQSHPFNKMLSQINFEERNGAVSSRTKTLHTLRFCFSEQTIELAAVC